VLRSLIVVRHARPHESGERPATWTLSADGLDHARRLGATLRAVVADTTVVSSTEPKAIETAEALGFGEVHRDERLREVGRPWYNDRQSFTHAARQYLSGVPVAGWESLDDAVARFGSAISELDGACIAVSHGTVMSAWLSRQVSAFDAAVFWNQLEMPDAWRVDLGARTLRRVAAGDSRSQR
jgi:broad specificity phosphatase PhoE